MGRRRRRRKGYEEGRGGEGRRGEREEGKQARRGRTGSRGAGRGGVAFKRVSQQMGSHISLSDIFTYIQTASYAFAVTHGCSTSPLEVLTGG